MGAVGVLHFEVTMARLKNEYGVDAIYEFVDYEADRPLGALR
jgi:peptide chain release factor 3